MKRTAMPRILSAVLVALMIVNAGCRTHPAATDPPRDVVTFVARDHAFDGPESVSFLPLLVVRGPTGLV
jgi:hypothetical protein